MNGDGVDDIVRMNKGEKLNIQYQTLPGQPFIASATLAVPGGLSWGMCTADFNNDGLGDELTGGRENGIKFIKSNPNGTFSTQNITNPITFVQGVNFADINKDGWLDAFVCHDDGISKIFRNNGSGSFSIQSGWINLATVPASDNSGNYGSVWSDINNDGHLDLYIAKCRQNVTDPTNPVRINQLFINNGDNTFKQDITNEYGLRIGAQSWTADFGDIDNDGDFDCFITNHDVSSQLLENDGTGHFTDISASSGGFIDDILGLPIQGVFKDFDNDGFVDILVSGSYQYLFHNNGDKTFTEIPNPFDQHQMESYAIGDLNADGFPDIYGGYAELFNDPSNIPDALWINNGNSNHFYGLNLRGQQSNRSAVGAKVRLYSALGTQTREVRSGESYGISNSFQIHFGLGQETQVDSVVINWPSGIRDVIYQPGIDEYNTVYEGGCIIPSVEIMASGPTGICPGETISMFTDQPYVQYQWSTGAMSSTITIGTTGNYQVTVTDANGCTAISNPITITVDPVTIPLISVLGDSILCEGGKVTLQSSPSTDYLWSTGATTQSIEVDQPGPYTVSAMGLCSFFSSTPLNITVLDAPEPQVEPDTIMIGETAQLSATGLQVAWYDSPTNQTPLAEGNLFTSPALTQNTTYWTSNTTSYGLPNDFVGMEYHQGSVNSDINYEGGLFFDCLQPFTLEKVKVYTALAGERKIVLQSITGNVLQSKTVFIPIDTSVVELDFDVPPGIDLLLTTDATVNMTNLGSAGPQLRRSSANISFPYEIPDVVRITTSTIGDNRYYYFYNWEIGFANRECTSDRVPVTVVVEDENSATFLPSWTEKIRIYPNPGNGQINIALEGYSSGSLMATFRNAQGQVIQTREFQASAGNALFKADLSAFPQGIYWLELTHEKGSIQRKMIKQ
jgi:hypothetical protein